jgi:PAS domain S-box-containing protein
MGHLQDAAHRSVPVDSGTEHERLRESEERFRVLVEAIAQATWETDAAGVVVADSPSWRAYTGQTLAQWLGYGWLEAIHPQDRAHAERQWREAVAACRNLDGEYRLRSPDGGWRWTNVRAAPIRSAEGEVVKWVGMNIDITDRKEMERSLVASEQHLRIALDMGYTVAFEWDIQRNEVRRQHSRLGALPETPEERPSSLEEVAAAVHPDDRERFFANVHAALAHPEQGYRGEHRLCEPDGRIVWLAEYGYLQCDGQGQPQRLIGLSQDITERKAAEAERERLLGEATMERDRLSALLKSIPDEVWFTDMHGQFTLANPAALKEFALPAGTPVDVRELAKRLEVLRPDGSPRPVEEAPPLRALKGETVVNQEEMIRTPARDDLRYRQVSATPVRDAAGKIIGAVSVVHDITERKRTEVALQESDRRKDAFLATLAHELRNPLAPIRTGLELIQMLRGDAAACQEPLQIMDRQISHLVRLVDDLLDVSRISRGKIELRKEPLELREVIDAALQMSGSGLSRDDRQLSVSVPSEPLVVEGDRVRLVQVIANLLNNAANFTELGGHIDVRVMARGEQVEIQVQDDGRGIPPERLDHIFEMFSQAEPGRDSGLGIGLALVRGLVAMHGGTVCADSEGPGRGATFTVSLPLCRSAPEQHTSDEATVQGILPPQRRILVVDDNRDIAESLDLLLTMMGAEVRVAHDGAEALRIFGDWPATHVLMDLGMPGMDGYEAARRLRANHPGCPFRLIAVTGWGQEEDRQRVREAGFDEHLVKPVRVAELKAVLSV